MRPPVVIKFKVFTNRTFDIFLCGEYHNKEDESFEKCSKNCFDEKKTSSLCIGKAKQIPYNFS